LARIRDIRASEKPFWRKVLDIYATSVYGWGDDDVKGLFQKEMVSIMKAGRRLSLDLSRAFFALRVLW
jgi:hypothetical protein